MAYSDELEQLRDQIEAIQHTLETARQDRTHRRERWLTVIEGATAAVAEQHRAMEERAESRPRLRVVPDPEERARHHPPHTDDTVVSRWPRTRNTRPDPSAHGP
ncbi:hypothetical protein GCM10027160_29470 [Streptomyces calidiresistens]|uniref:Uncharacterized protein n=1 Tax=Streptomyces calidiresistens TaxID=1485586 RepID=A0A7W3XVX0_9ACTN|nr:hypothetical protein [Streptomyces calidiresistens]MBB0229132.1 hypothetical protein [Streptomyces calidiresistens]